MAVVGAVAILLSAAGLAADAVRPGPLTVGLQAAVVPVEASGSYLAEGPATGPLGACVLPPCLAQTRVVLQLVGLPPVPYTMRLEGPASEKDLGPLVADGGALVLDYEAAEDHTDKTSVVLLLAGRPLHAWPVGPGERSLTSDVAASLALPGVDLHLDEIGAVVVSTVAKASLADPGLGPLEARLEDGSRHVTLGAFDGGPATATLDARRERVRLDDYQTVAVVVRLGDHPAATFPLWRAAY